MPRLYNCLVLLALAMSLFSLSSCQSNQDSDAIHLGALLSLSGPASYFGQDELNAVKLAVDDANALPGKKVVLTVEDAKTLDTPYAISTLRKMVEVDNIHAVVGPTWDMPGVAEAADAFTSVGSPVILISPSSTPSVESGKDFPYFYSTLHPVRAETDALAHFAIKNKWNRVAVIYDEDSFSESIKSNFDLSAREKGVEIQAQRVSTGVKDFRTQILKAMEGKPGAIFVVFASEEPLGPLLRQLDELGEKIPVLGVSSMESPNLLRDYATYAEGRVFYAFPKTTLAKQGFQGRYKSKYGSLPSAPTATNAYDAASILITELRQTTNASEIKSELDKTVFNSVSFGSIRFDLKGFVSLDSAEMVIKTVKSGQFVEVQ